MKGTGSDPFGGFAVQSEANRRRVAERIIREALDGMHRKRIGEYRRNRDLLADAVRGAAESTTVQPGRVVNEALLGLLQQETQRAWSRGWQPAELARTARRERSERHSRLMVDAMAAQMRSYAAAAVTPAWQAQLDELSVSVWWERDDEHADRWAQREKLNRAAAVDHLLQLLDLLAGLPPLPQVGAAPGGGGNQPRRARPARAGIARTVGERMLDRVRNLLAKAESTDFPEEAEAFSAKAQELIARHSIADALVAAETGNHDGPATRRVALDNPHEAPKTLLLQVVAEANRCRAVWTKRFGFTTLVGYSSDLDATELVFGSLLVQATRAMTQLNPRPDRYGRNTTTAFRESFLTAYAHRIGERLSAATREADEEVAGEPGGTDALPVLAARTEAVRDTFDTLFPSVTSHATPIHNQAGWLSGQAAADQAALHGHKSLRT